MFFRALTLALTVLSASASAAITSTWTGSGADPNWATVANWNNGVPGSADAAVFSSGSLPCFTNSFPAVQTLTISGGYSGTLTIGGTFTVNGILSQSGGTIAFSGSTLNVGSLLISGGTFNGASGNLSSLTGGTVSLSGAGIFYAPTGNFQLGGSLSIPAGVSFTPGATIRVSNSSAGETLNAGVPIGTIQMTGASLTLTADADLGSYVAGSNSFIYMNGHNINVSGGWTDDSGLRTLTGSETLIFNGTGAQSCAEGDLQNMSVSKPSGTLSLINDLEVDGLLKVLSGTLDCAGRGLQCLTMTVATGAIFSAATSSSQTHVMPGGLLSVANGAFFSASNGRFFVEGAMNVAPGAFYTPGSVAIEFGFGSNTQELLQAGVNIGNIDVASGSLSLTADTTVAGLSVNSYLAPGPYTLHVTGDCHINTNNFAPASGTVVFDGAGAQSVNGNGGNFFSPSGVSFPTLTVAKPFGSTLTVAGSVLAANTVNVNSGTLDANDQGVMANTMNVNAGAAFLGGHSGQGGLLILPGGSLNVAAAASFTAPSINTVMEGSLNVAAGAFFTPSGPITFVQGQNEFINAAVDIGDISIQQGDVSLTANLTVNKVTVGGGWFDPSPYVLSVEGDWNGGSADATNFSPAGGSVVFNSSVDQTMQPTGSFVIPARFHDVTVSKPAGTLAISGQTMFADTLNVTQGGVSVPSSGGIDVTDLNITGGTLDGGSFGSLVIESGGLLSVQSGGVFNAPGANGRIAILGSVDIAAGAVVNPGRAMSFQAGASPQSLRAAVPMGDISVDGASLTVTGDTSVNNVTLNNGWFYPGAYTLSVAGNWNNSNGGAVFHSNAGNIAFSGTGNQIISDFDGGSEPFFNNLTVNKPSGTLTIQGQGTFVTGTATLSQGTLTMIGLLFANDIVVNNGGTLTGDPANGTLKIVPGGLLSINSGGQFTMMNQCDIQGGFNAASGALITPLSGKHITFDANGQGQFLQSAVNIGDIEVGGALTLTADTTVNSILIDSGAWLNPGSFALAVSGDWKDFSSFPARPAFEADSGTVSFVGTGTQTLVSFQACNFCGSGSYFHNLTIEKPSGNIDQESGIEVAGQLTVDQGTWSSAHGGQLYASKMRVNSGGIYDGSGGGGGTVSLYCLNDLKVLSGGVLIAPTSGTYQVAGNCEMLTGALLTPAPNRTLEVVSPGGLFSSGVPVGNVEVDSGAALGLGGDLTVNSIMIDGGGTLNLNGQVLSDKGDFNNRTFSPLNVGLGTLNLCGVSQTVWGPNTFQNLSKVATGPSSLYFQDSLAQVVTGQLTLQGPSFAPIVIDSQSGSPHPFYLDLSPTGSASLVQLNVHDSDASGGIPLTALNSINAGNNVNWIFDAFSPTVTPTFSVSPTYTPTPTASPTLTATPTATMTATPSPSATASPSPTLSVTATVTPTFTATPTVTITIDATMTSTPTPAFALSTFGKPVLAPVPAHAGQPICLYFDSPPASSTWQVYGVDRQKVADLSFAGQYSQCWPTDKVAPGIYLIRVAVTYQNGSSQTHMIKAMVVR